MLARSRRTTGVTCLALGLVASAVVVADPVIHEEIARGQFTEAYDHLQERIDKGREPNERSPQRLTTVQVAAIFGAYDVMRALLEYGIEPDYANAFGQSLLALAIVNGQPGIVELLLYRGADVNRADAAGITPLMRAVSVGDKSVVSSLLERGADVSARDRYGADPLIYAADTHRAGPAIYDLLLGHGAPVDTVDATGYSAMYLAARNGNIHLYEKLTALGLSRGDAEAEFERRQLRYNGYSFGVQLNEPDGRCDDSRFPYGLYNERRPALPWQDASDCIDLFMQGEITCMREFECKAEHIDGAQRISAIEGSILSGAIMIPVEQDYWTPIARPPAGQGAVVYVDTRVSGLALTIPESAFPRGFRLPLRDMYVEPGTTELFVSYEPNVRSPQRFQSGESKLYPISFETVVGRTYKVLLEQPVSADRFNIRVVELESMTLVHASDNWVR